MVDTTADKYPPDLDADGRHQLKAMREVAASQHEVDPELEPLPRPVPTFDDRLLADIVRNSPPHATVPLRVLTKSGLRLRHPDKLHDDKVGDELWLAIHAMALLGFYLLNTDHLDDHELYRLVYEDFLQEPTRLRFEGEMPSYMHDLAMGGDDDGLRAWLTYYADALPEEDRQEMWEFDDPLPERSEPPHDRDRYLP